MKTLTVLWAIFCLAACGGNPNPNIDPPKQCIGDQDCPTRNKCLDNVCVENPECADDTECTKKDLTLVCFYGTCTPYIMKDSCYNKTCGTLESGDCAACGLLTSCRKNVCDDSCSLSHNDAIARRSTICSDSKSICMSCVCWRDNNKINIGNDGCVEGDVQFPACTIEDSKKYKNIMTGDYTKFQQDAINFWKDQCSKGYNL